MSIELLTKVLFILYSLPESLVAFEEGDVACNGNYGIAGGEPSEIGDHPHLVSLQWNDYTHFCGGNLINRLHVVTAAHCIFRPFKGGLTDRHKFLIMVGDISISKKKSGCKRAIRLPTLIFVHEGFNRYNMKNDIAVLRLSRALTIGRPSKYTAISVVRLNNKPIKEHTSCEVAGWGQIYSKSKLSSRQNKVNIKVLPNEVCSNAYKNLFTSPEMFCAGTYLGGKDAGKGDSGGGLICGGLLSGVVSCGKGCGLRECPGIYTNVTHYKKWIRNCTRFKGTQADIRLPLFWNSSSSTVTGFYYQFFAVVVLLK